MLTSTEKAHIHAVQTIPQRLDAIQALLESIELSDTQDPYDGEVKTGKDRKEGYLRLIKSIRDTYDLSGSITSGMEKVLNNLEIELRKPKT